ncbi:acyl-CoA synthetase [Varunaivibrio sulfuroxidans]|uniref:3-methylmercaptopropionyl-CoA ligase n=1 Tax=Varunaivibrio sulfuroxidans TaxID=1773489 RepID=A0A4R3JBT7_9PROT|nr:acyl-CoA synthetase [Varunaivibrio sulfuroxidans]TCS63114.1 fatty-acyl-CoA synthase [Varunaivibrio sulfuroxidans]WES31814.1 acyl-CoA synthetase [Varunaivibrio sulfuroxidans]
MTNDHGALRAPTNPYQDHLDKNAANFTALSPLSLLRRAADIFPTKTALIHGGRRYTWAETLERTTRLASALNKRGIAKNDTVAVMGANTPEMYECAFAVAMAGAVLNPLNIRLDGATLAFCLNHGEAKVLITDREFAPAVKDALAGLGRELIVIDIDDGEYDGPGERLGETDYESFLRSGDPDFAWALPADEWDAISLNYTSGTTGNPKGVVYHHRGAYLNALSNIIAWDMPSRPIYLWTLPMFHCNGWCFPWTLAALGGTNVCLRRVGAKAMFDAFADLGVTHYCGAPIVHNLLINAKADERRDFSQTVYVMTAAAPPPPATLDAMEAMGFDVTHAYGLTETYGPAVYNAWQEPWDALDHDVQMRLRARQGVRYPVLEDLEVMDGDTMVPVPRDGQTIGEIMFKGNVVMKGYLKNPGASAKAFAGGWFHSGDLAVMHPDGYVEIKDRAKDIIISGGENISSIEVEGALYKHPAVLAAAVVAKSDPKWGETPCAFVELKDDAPEPTSEEIIAFCRDNLAHFKCPRHVVFGPLPKTSTGKIQKFKLRERVGA